MPRLFSGLTVVLLAPSLLAQRTPDVRVNTDPPGSARSWAPHIAASGSSVYVAWDDWRRRGGASDIYFNYSSDRGATWHQDQRINTDPPFWLSSQRCCQVAAWQDNVYVVWQDCRYSGPYIYLNYSTDRGASWLANDLVISRGTASSTRPQIAVSGQSVYATWVDDRNAGPNWTRDIYFNHSSNGGATWQNADVRLNAGVTIWAVATLPQIAAVGSSVYVVWQDDRNGRWSGNDILLNHSLDRGATWLSSEVRLDTDPAGTGNSVEPQIAVSGSSVYVVWQDGRSGSTDIYFNRSTDGGATWLTSDLRLDTDAPGAAASEYPQIAVAGSNVYVVWQDRRNGPSANSDIYVNYSTDGGATWSSQDVRINTSLAGSSAAVRPQLVASGSAVHVAWQDNRNGRDDIYFNRSTDAGATWLGADVRLDTNGAGRTYSQMPDIAQSGSSVYVTWHDERNRGAGLEDIYFNVPFGALAYGDATAGTGGVAPQLAATGSITLGSSISVDVSHGLGGALGALWVGVGPSSKTSVPFAGGTLLVQPTVAVPLLLSGAVGVPGAGSSSLPLSIPSLPSLVGANLNFQAVFVDAGAAFGLSMTNGLEMWIG